MIFSGRIFPSPATLFRIFTNFLLAFLCYTALADLALALPFNGICSSANNGQFVDTPSTGLCTAGTPSAVSGIGPWSWTCAGSGGGSDASCSAVQAGGVFYKSSDAGLNWTGKATGIGFNSPIEALAASPAYASDHTIFLGSGVGVYKSANSGDNWTQVQSGYSVKALAISPAFATDRTIFSGQMLAGIYKSTDTGATWNAANTGLASTQIRSLAISPNFASDQTIFAGILGQGVYKSSNGGASWVTANTGIATLTGQSLAVSPAYSSDQTIFVASTGNHIYRSSDGGASWLQTDIGISGSIYKLGISPFFNSDQTLFAATSSGIYKSTDSGNSWTLTKPTAAQTFLAISPFYVSDQTLFAGIYGDNVYTSSTGGNSWSPSSSNFATIRQLSALGTSPAFSADRNVFAAAYFAGPALTVSPYSLAFGNIATGAASISKQVTISNGMFGDANLAITSITLSGTDAAQYGISPGTCASLTPTLVKGGQCTIDVQFAPSSTGSKSAALQINSNAVMSPTASVTLSGTGISVTSTITSPATGFYTNSTSVAVSGTATCSGGCTVSLVEVSADNGVTWQPASGTTSWSAAIPVPTAKSYTIKSRATTSEGLIETPSSGITVNVYRTPPTASLELYFGLWVLDARDSMTFCFERSYPSICGQLEMSFNGSNWQPATTNLITGSPLWLRDRAGNTAYISGGSVANSIGGPLRIDGGSYYSFLQHALNAAGSGNTIKLSSTALSENLTLANNVALTIKGGYDSNLGSVTGITPLNGNLTVQAGSLTIENIAMTGTMTVGSGSVNVTNLTIK